MARQLIQIYATDPDGLLLGAAQQGEPTIHGAAVAIGISPNTWQRAIKGLPIRQASARAIAKFLETDHMELFTYANSGEEINS